MTTIASIEPLGTIPVETDALLSGASASPQTVQTPKTADLPALLSDPMTENARLTASLDKALSDVRQLVSKTFQPTATPTLAVEMKPVTVVTEGFVVANPAAVVVENLAPAVKVDSTIQLRETEVVSTCGRRDGAVASTSIATQAAIAQPAVVIETKSETVVFETKPAAVTVVDAAALPRQETPAAAPAVDAAALPRQETLAAAPAVDAAALPRQETPAAAPAVDAAVLPRQETPAAAPAVDAAALPRQETPVAAPVVAQEDAAVPIVAQQDAAAPIVAQQDAATLPRPQDVSSAAAPVVDAAALPRQSDEVAEVEESAPETLAAAMTAAGVVPQAADVAASRPVEGVAPVASVSATATTAAILPSQVLVETAQAVADTLIVTPGLMRGQGSVTVQLKSDVLQGSQVTIDVHGKQLDVSFQSSSVDVAVLVERNLSRIQEYLGARIPSFNVGVKMRKTRG